MKNYILILLILVSLSGYTQISFEEKALTLGIDCGYGGGTFSGGAVFYDFNGDGWDDITLATASGDSIYFYINNEGTFEQVIPSYIQDTLKVKQILWADYDNDGDKDLFTSGHWQSCKLYENDGDFNFTDVTEYAGITTTSKPAQGAAWGDYNNDGYLDLYICIYDAALYLLKDILYENNGDGTFTDVSNASGIQVANRAPFGLLFTDFTDDGYQDIYVAVDRGDGNTMLNNNGDNTFENITLTSGGGIEMYSMTATPLDFDNDGDEDYYFTNLGVWGSKFVENTGDLLFQEISEDAGVNWMHVGWGAVSLDADLDGDEDLFVSGMETGYEYDHDPSIFYENQGDGTFLEAAELDFLNDTIKSFSNARGDINNDGLPDFVVNNGDGYLVTLWENTTPTDNHYLKVKTNGTIGNLDGIGSSVTIYINGELQFRYRHCGSGYMAQSEDYAWFGTGTSILVDSIEVKWLSGLVDMIYDVGVDQMITVEEGQGLVGIQDHEKPSFSIFPNPANDRLSIRFSENLNDPHYTISDINGKILDNGRLSNTSSNQSIDVSEFPNGSYFINIISEEKTESKVFIIQR